MRVVVLFLLLASPALAQDPPFVRVQRESATPYKFSTGSGTLLKGSGGSLFVLTCKHVVPDGERGISIHTGGRQYAATFVEADKTADLTLLRVDGLKTENTAPLADCLPPPGAVFWQRGCPKGGPAVFKSGPADNLLGDPWWICIVSQPGDSGAGLFWNGKLCGVTKGGNGTLATCEPLPALRRFILSTPK